MQHATKLERKDYPFSCLGEVLYLNRFEKGSPRYKAALDMNIGDSGGIMVPPSFRDRLLSVPAQDAIVRPRATVIPADEEKPDQELKLPALNQGTNLHGGLVLKYTKSGTAKPETDIDFRLVSVQPEEYSGWVEVPDNLIRNWRTSNSTIERIFLEASAAFEDDQFLISGDGIAKPLSVLNSDATIAINRASANDVTYADVLKMYKSFLKRGLSGIWTYNPSIIEKFLNMTGPQGATVWTPPLNENEAGRLFGLPAIPNPRQADLGSKGDLMLSDFSYYLVKDGFGPFVAASEHVEFKNNKTIIKFFSNHDGQPWIDGTVKDEDGNTYSPFVVLDVPAA